MGSGIFTQSEKEWIYKIFNENELIHQYLMSNGKQIHNEINPN